MKKNFIFALGLLLVTGFSACSSEIEDGTTDIDSWPMPYIEVEGRYTYQHPCAMFNEADFTRVKTMLEDGTAPQAVKDEFETLKNMYLHSDYLCGISYGMDCQRRSNRYGSG